MRRRWITNNRRWSQNGKWVTEREISRPPSSSVTTPKHVVCEAGRFHGWMITFSPTQVIDRVVALDTDEIDGESLKWVILMVLFNQPGQEQAYAWMEDLLFDGVQEHLH